MERGCRQLRISYHTAPHTTSNLVLLRVPKARPKSKGKTKPSRGLDLEEVRRRTSLLSGQHGGAGVGAGARASLPPPSSAIGPPAPSLAVASRVAGGSSLMSPSSSANYDLGWRRQQQQQASAGSGGPFSDTSSHPLHASTPLDNTFAQESMVGTFDTRGNYFNEDLLRVRAKESKTFASDPLARPAASNGSAAPAGQGAWGGDALMGSAGSFLSTAKWVVRRQTQDVSFWRIVVDGSVGAT